MITGRLQLIARFFIMKNLMEGFVERLADVGHNFCASPLQTRGERSTPKAATALAVRLTLFVSLELLQCLRCRPEVGVYIRLQLVTTNLPLK